MNVNGIDNDKTTFSVGGSLGSVVRERVRSSCELEPQICVVAVNMEEVGQQKHFFRSQVSTACRGN